MHKLGWLDQERRPLVRAWIRKQLVDKMGKDYSFDVRPLIPVAYLLPRLTARLQELPLEYNTWLLFRQAVDIILIKWVSILGICLRALLKVCFLVISCHSVCSHLPASVYRQDSPCSFMCCGESCPCLRVRDVIAYPIAVGSAVSS